MPAPTVELLYFEGCPNHHAARELVERAATERGLAIDLRLVEVTSPEDAELLRFLGSPTVRVNGRDVEPGADARHGFVLASELTNCLTDDRETDISSSAWTFA